MKTSEFKTLAESLFPKSTLDFLNDGNQYGFNHEYEKEIKRVGYCVNLTAKIIEQAKNNHIDLILSHHNIWEEYAELREDCLGLLHDSGIIHYFNHLPLDSAPFGPSRVLARDLGLEIKAEFCQMENLFFGVIGEYEEPVTLAQLQTKLEDVLGHPARVWQNNDRMIKRVGLVAGSGGDLETLHDAHELKCDAYITGEKKLKTVLYCEHVRMNFLLGSHTFTEKGGLNAFAKQLSSRGGAEYIELCETHIE